MAIVTHTLHRPPIPCLDNPTRNGKNSFYSNYLHDSDTMTTRERGAWHRRRGMAQGRFRAIDYAMKNSCLAIPQAASPCQVENTKKPAVTRAWVCLVPDPAGRCRTRNHSHSIVAGGFPDTSYTTRLMPRTSLMMRFDTRPSSSCGRCAQWAVMKSWVWTARSATTNS